MLFVCSRAAPASSPQAPSAGWECTDWAAKPRDASGQAEPSLHFASESRHSLRRGRQQGWWCPDCPGKDLLQQRGWPAHTASEACFYKAACSSLVLGHFYFLAAPTTETSPTTSPAAASLCPSHAVCSWWPELWSSSHRMLSWHLFLQCFAKTVTGVSVRAIPSCRRCRGVGRQPRCWGAGRSFMLPWLT